MDEAKAVKYEKRRKEVRDEALKIIERREKENKNPKYDEIFWNKACDILIEEFSRERKKIPHREKDPKIWAATALYMTGKELPDYGLTQSEAAEIIGDIGPDSISSLFNEMGDSRGYFDNPSLGGLNG